MNLLFRAVHNLPWGTLESEEVLVEVTEPLGKVSFILNITVMVNIISMPHVRNYCFFQGALVLDFVCRVKLEAAFVVTGVKVRALIQKIYGRVADSVIP